MKGEKGGRVPGRAAVGLALALGVSGWGVAGVLGQGMGPVGVAGVRGRTPLEALGESLFRDVGLSDPVGQSCASCHSEGAGFTFPDSEVNRVLGVAPGAVAGRFGSRAVPSVGYAAYGQPGPPRFRTFFRAYIGGLFWDGRASGLEEQARFPFLDPNEMNNRSHGLGDPGRVVAALEAGALAGRFRAVFGDDVFARPADEVFGLVAGALAAYERSDAVSPFSSKYDAWRAGGAELTEPELRGLRLVTGSWTGRPGGTAFPRFAQCVDCHAIPSVPSATEDVWTNTCYQNLGVPRNAGNPFYRQTDGSSNPEGYNPLGEAFVDYGLGANFYPGLGLPAGNAGPGSDGRGDFLAVNGLFKAPSLRNVDRRPAAGFVKAYMHNGALKSVAEVVHFYNTRNLTTQPGEVIDFTRAEPYAGLAGTPLWPPPEYASPETLLNAEGLPGSTVQVGTGGESPAQVGNLELTEEEEADIVAFLSTLSDGFFSPGPGCGRITSQPVSQPVCLGGGTTFTVASRGGASGYQWRHGGVAIAGATDSFYTVSSAAWGDAGVYDCVVTTACGVVTSRGASLTVCGGDYNCDGVVEASDYDAFVAAFEAGDADLDGDGFVDFFDYDAFVSAFEVGCVG